MNLLKKISENIIFIVVFVIIVLISYAAYKYTEAGFELSFVLFGIQLLFGFLYFVENNKMENIAQNTRKSINGYSQKTEEHANEIKNTNSLLVQQQDLLRLNLQYDNNLYRWPYFRDVDFYKIGYNGECYLYGELEYLLPKALPIIIVDMTVYTHKNMGVGCHCKNGEFINMNSFLVQGEYFYWKLYAANSYTLNGSEGFPITSIISNDTVKIKNNIEKTSEIKTPIYKISSNDGYQKSEKMYVVLKLVEYESKPNKIKNNKAEIKLQYLDCMLVGLHTSKEDTITGIVCEGVNEMDDNLYREFEKIMINISDEG